MCEWSWGSVNDFCSPLQWPSMIYYYYYCSSCFCCCYSYLGPSQTKLCSACWGPIGAQKGAKILLFYEACRLFGKLNIKRSDVWEDHIFFRKRWRKQWRYLRYGGEGGILYAGGLWDELSVTAQSATEALRLEFPGGASLVVQCVRFHLLVQGVWVQSLFGELGSHMPKKQKVKQTVVTDSINTFKFVHIEKKNLSFPGNRMASAKALRLEHY